MCKHEATRSRISAFNITVQNASEKTALLRQCTADLTGGAGGRKLRGLGWRDRKGNRGKAVSKHHIEAQQAWAFELRTENPAAQLIAWNRMLYA